MGNTKEGKCVHILFTEETKYTIFYGSMPEGMLKNTNGVFYESVADSYRANLPITACVQCVKSKCRQPFSFSYFHNFVLRKNKQSK